MAVLPSRVADAPYVVGGKSSSSVQTYLTSRGGYQLLNRGKVRDTYSVRLEPNKLLMVASDRVSIFDFVLPALVPGKGAVLTALTHFWLTKHLTNQPNHLVPSTIEPRYNAAYDHALRMGSGFPLERSLVVKKVSIQPYEMIFRYHLGGSVWKQYLKDGTAGGHKLPPGLKRWQKLDTPIFTPSTKEESGHDVNITAESYLKATGEPGREAMEKLRQVYQIGYDWAWSRGIVYLDTKFEYGNPYILADEALTPDSSRITTVEEYLAAMAEGRDPIFYDKEPVRQYGLTIPTPTGVTGINALDPQNAAHLAFVHNEIDILQDVTGNMAERYQQIFAMLVGQSLIEYQQKEMGVKA